MLLLVELEARADAACETVCLTRPRFFITDELDQDGTGAVVTEMAAAVPPCGQCEAVAEGGAESAPGEGGGGGGSVQPTAAQPLPPAPVAQPTTAQAGQPDSTGGAALPQAATGAQVGSACDSEGVGGRSLQLLDCSADAPVCFPRFLSDAWTGNGVCDNGNAERAVTFDGRPLNLNCSRFAFDGGECLSSALPLVPDDSEATTPTPPASPPPPETMLAPGVSVVQPQSWGQGATRVAWILPVALVGATALCCAVLAAAVLLRNARRKRRAVTRLPPKPASEGQGGLGERTLSDVAGFAQEDEADGPTTYVLRDGTIVLSGGSLDSAGAKKALMENTTTVDEVAGLQPRRISPPALALELAAELLVERRSSSSGRCYPSPRP